MESRSCAVPDQVLSLTSVESTGLFGKTEHQHTTARLGDWGNAGGVFFSTRKSLPRATGMAIRTGEPGENGRSWVRGGDEHRIGETMGPSMLLLLPIGRRDNIRWRVALSYHSHNTHILLTLVRSKPCIYCLFAMLGIWTVCMIGWVRLLIDWNVI
jgi:hypothetical protein